MNMMNLNILKCESGEEIMEAIRLNVVFSMGII